jgi:hypothetical protein
MYVLGRYEEPKTAKSNNPKRTPKEKEKEKEKDKKGANDGKGGSDGKALPSGIDMVVLLDIDADTWSRRLGERRVDPLTNAEYNLEVDPPPINALVS